MIVQGTGSAAANSCAIPAHAVGDIILIFVRAAQNFIAVKPAAGGTVPDWTPIIGAAANSLALVSYHTTAVATNTTTGTWTNAVHFAVMVLRADAGKKIAVVVPSSAQGNANNTQSIVYPAITLTTLAGSSWGVRCGTRTVAVTAVGTAPTNWTQRIVQPAAAAALMSVHTRAALTANPVADTVTTTGTNAASRAQTFEVTEQILVTQQPMVTIA
jgi:hypothetical protein